jgi:hypothetical protein
VPQVDIAKIDRDFFCFGRLGSKFAMIPSPSFCHLAGWYMDGLSPSFKVLTRNLSPCQCRILSIAEPRRPSPLAKWTEFLLDHLI